MSSPISKEDLSGSAIFETSRGRTASGKAIGHETSSRDEAHVSLNARIRLLRSYGQTPELIAAELGLSVKTINSYLQPGS